MNNIQKFNLYFKIGILLIIVIGSLLIYFFPNKINISFWVTLFFVWIFSYRPIINKFFYSNNLDNITYKMQVLSEILLDWHTQKKNSKIKKED